MMKDQTILCVSAHAADFVWRAGGTLAKYAQAGADVHLLVLSLGARGESGDLWRKPGQTAAAVKAVRLRESQEAAAALGLKNVEYWDLEDFPLVIGREELDRLALKIRTVRPDIILTHGEKDITNPDHDAVFQAVFQAIGMAGAAGADYGDTKAAGPLRLFGFEPYQPELSRFMPDVFIDVTSAADRKIAAMRCFQAQEKLIGYYTERLSQRGDQARRFSGNGACRFAEAFTRIFPYVGEAFA